MKRERAKYRSQTLHIGCLTNPQPKGVITMFDPITFLIAVAVCGVAKKIIDAGEPGSGSSNEKSSSNESSNYNESDYDDIHQPDYDYSPTPDPE